MTWHAKLSASSTKTWLTCPGGVAYAQFHNLDGGSSGVSAMQGTAAHALVEKCLREDKEPIDFVGYTIKLVNPATSSEVKFSKRKSAKPPNNDDGAFLVDDDMIEATSCMVRYVRQRVEDLGVTMDDVKIETRVHPLSGEYQAFTGGTGDVIIDAWPEVLEIVDYKHGSGVHVPIEGNYQLRSYALGAMRNSNDPDDSEYNTSYDRIVYTICQPRHIKAPYGGVSSESASPHDLVAFAAELTEAVDKYLLAADKVAEGATLEDLLEDNLISVGTDGSACTFCPLKATCPAIYSKAQEMALLDFADEIPEEIEVPGNNRLAVIMPWIPFIKSWLTSVEKAAEEELLSGRPVDGYKLVRTSSPRRWRTDLDEGTLVKTAAAEFNLDEGALYNPPKLITGPQAMKLVPAKLKADFEAKLIERGVGELTIAPLSDKRPAEVKSNAADDFDGAEL